VVRIVGLVEDIGFVVDIAAVDRTLIDAYRGLVEGQLHSGRLQRQQPEHLGFDGFLPSFSRA
jgi:hypothetical protein